MPKLSEMERIIRALERYDFHFYSVSQGGALRGVLTLLPDYSQFPAATRRTIAKWEDRWMELSKQESTRTIAEHLAGTGRTEALREARRQSMSGKFHRPDVSFY